MTAIPFVSLAHRRLAVPLALGALLAASQAGAAPFGNDRSILDIQTSIPSLKQRFANDTQWNAIAHVVIDTADYYLANPEQNSLSQRSNDGLAQARQCERIVYNTSFAYVLTGDARYRKRAADELLSLSARGADGQPSYPQWSDGKNLLSVAEMSACFALGYRWNREALNGDQRALVMRRLVDAGLNWVVNGNKLAEYFSPSGKLYAKGNYASSNWNGVVNGGLSVAAMAIYNDPDAPPGYTARNHASYDAILDAYHTYLPIALDRMSDGIPADRPLGGVWDEGLTYYSYFANYVALSLAARRDILRRPDQLESDPRLVQGADFYIAMTSPSHKTFNFGDAGTDASFVPISYFALSSGRPALLKATQNFLHWFIAPNDPKKLGGTPIKYTRTGWTLPFYLLWYQPSGKDALSQAPHARIFKGSNGDFLSVRSSWTDRNALFLAAKGGRPAATHAKMDAGTFVIEGNGVRWVDDIAGTGNYGLKNYFGDLQEQAFVGRWQYFVNNNLSQNTLTFFGADGNPDPQNPNGVGKVMNAKPNFPGTDVVFDLSSIYHGSARRVTRRFQVISSTELRIEDTFDPVGDTTKARWAAIFCKSSGADSVVVTANRAILKKGGHQAVWTIVSPADAQFVLETTDPSARANDHQTDADGKLNAQRKQSQALNMPKSSLCSRLAVYTNTSRQRAFGLTFALQ